jgi:hypothetical protein
MLKKILVAGTAISMLVSTPAFAEWRMAESDNFQIISAGRDVAAGREAGAVQVNPHRV